MITKPNQISPHPVKLLPSHKCRKFLIILQLVHNNMYYCAVSFFNTLVQASDKYSNYISIFEFGNNTDSEIVLI